MANNKLKVKTRLQINATVVTAVTILAVILVNIIAYELNFKKMFFIDTTATKTYEFSDETKYFFNHMDKDVTLYALFPEDGYSDPIPKSLEQFPRISKKIKLQKVDMYRNPEFVRKYEEKGSVIENYSVIVDAGDKFEVVSMGQMYIFDQNGQQKLNVESTIINAIVNVTRSDKVTRAYFTIGQGERPDEKIMTLLGNDNYYISTVNVNSEGVPEDAELLICVAPTIDFTPEAIESMDKFFDNGGNGAFFFAPGMEKLPRLENYLNEWGIGVNHDYVIEGDPAENLSEAGFKNVIYTRPQQDDYDINYDLILQERRIAVPETCSLTLSDENNASSAKVTAMLKTTAKSYSKEGVSEIANRDYAYGDKKGPFTIAAMARRSTPDGNDYGNIFVSGSYSAYDGEGNDYLSQAAFANADFLLNILNAFTGRTDDSIKSISPKNASTPGLMMTQQQVENVTFVLQWVIPISIFVIGLIVWIRRRYL